MPNEHSPSPSFSSSSSDEFRLTLDHRLRLVREIAKLVKARMPLETALSNLAGQSSGSFSQTVETVHQRLRMGQSLSDSLARGSDPSTYMLAASIELGELSGALDQSLDHWADYYLTRRRYTRRLSSAILYPLLLVWIALASILYSVWRLMPQYRQAFAQLADTQPAWLGVLDFVNQYFVWLASTLVIVVGFVLWKCFGNRQAVDRWSIPRSEALRNLFYSRTAQMSAWAIQSGRPVQDWIGLVLNSVGTKRDGLAESVVADDQWCHRLGRETCGVLVGLAAGQLNLEDSRSLLGTIADNLKMHADLAIERQVHRWPMLTSVIVGAVAAAAYLGLIYLPWLALYYHIAKNT